MNPHYDIVIVGAGISGSVIAERYASLGKKILIIEKRDHIGGNCYDYKDENDILVSKYGAHLFHTKHPEVWEYVNRFAEWYPWEHKVLAKVDDKLVPIPVNINTVNILMGTNIKTEQEMEEWLQEIRVKIDEPKNGEETVINKIGTYLYEKLFKHYTFKQWKKYPIELDRSVLDRIPVRTNFEDRYFTDTYQALPKRGYTKMFENMLNNPNIHILLNTDYFEVKDMYTDYEKLFFTGPIDNFFENSDGIGEKLEYRSIHFEWESIDQEYFQENSVINYPGSDVDFTRIIEYKHFGNQKSKNTTIVREYSVDTGDPYYPVPNQRNRDLYEKYKIEADKLKDIYFVGRLANYKYFNMDEAFKNALDLFEKIEQENGKLI